MGIILLATVEAHSAQIIAGNPDETIRAVVSRSEPTLIRIDGHRILRIFGAEGDFLTTPDKENGVAYIRPNPKKHEFSVYVVDDAGNTWKLRLSVSNGEAENIVIKTKAAKNSCNKNRNLMRISAIKEVFFALLNSEEAIRPVHQTVPLWSEVKFVLAKEIVNAPFKGEQYLLTNISPSPMVIDEREFYKNGVVAVSVERTNIQPKETISVYVISEAGE